MKNKNIISGVYCIENIVNNKKYIGATDNLKERWMNHRIDLRNGKHKNSFLQNEYNEHGLEKFNFYVLEECEKQFLNERETYYIKKYKTMYYQDGYNISLENKISEITKNKISIKNSGKTCRIEKRRYNPTSKYLGVDIKKNGKYCSRIYFDNQQYNLGYFETEVEAAMAYNEASQELLGWGAKLNIIGPIEIEKAWEYNG